MSFSNFESWDQNVHLGIGEFDMETVRLLILEELILGPLEIRFCFFSSANYPLVYDKRSSITQ